MEVSAYIQQVSLGLVPVLFSVSVHEVAHGVAAYALGDTTARDAGRLTLNPLKHLDVLGLIVFLVTRIIGWAKPVPVNPYNLKNPKRDMMFVAAAGPSSNVVMAVAAAFLFKLLIKYDSAVLEYVSYFMKYGVVPSLKGTYMVSVPVAIMLLYGVVINVALCLFNLIPILPLDGGRILYGLLPERLALGYARVERWGILIVVVLILAGLDRFFGRVVLDASFYLLGLF